MTRTTKEWQNILDKTPPYVAKEFTGGSIGSLAQKLIREKGSSGGGCSTPDKTGGVEGPHQRGTIRHL